MCVDRFDCVAYLLLELSEILIFGCLAVYFGIQRVVRLRWIINLGLGFVV